MFNLDFRLFNLIYNQCKSLGSVFNYGAFEGAIFYLSFIMLGITTVINKKDVKK